MEIAKSHREIAAVTSVDKSVKRLISMSKGRRYVTVDDVAGGDVAGNLSVEDSIRAAVSRMHTENLGEGSRISSKSTFAKVLGRGEILTKVDETPEMTLKFRGSSVIVRVRSSTHLGGPRSASLRNTVRVLRGRDTAVR